MPCKINQLKKDQRSCTLGLGSRRSRSSVCLPWVWPNMLVKRRTPKSPQESHRKPANRFILNSLLLTHLSVMFFSKFARMTRHLKTHNVPAHENLKLQAENTDLFCSLCDKLFNSLAGVKSQCCRNKQFKVNLYSDGHAHVTSRQTSYALAYIYVA